MAELVVLNGARAGAVFELPEMPTVVGRSPEAHFQLDDPWISSMHAMFERRGDDLWVVDLESRNGTFLGPERVQEARVEPGSVLRFGRTEVRIETQEARVRDPQPRTATQPLPATRPTSRLNAPDITGPHPPVRGAPTLTDALPFAPRAVALLRLALHVQPDAPPPDAGRVRAAVETLHRTVLAEGGLSLRHGSGALAVFGVAGPSPDDAGFALRAARAALADVESLDAGFTVRAALDQGQVLLGNVAGADGYELAALGEVAERLERILALASPGEILVGPGGLALTSLEDEGWRRVGDDELRVARARR